LTSLSIIRHMSILLLHIVNDSFNNIVKRRILISLSNTHGTYKLTGTQLRPR
jgi:hypothetical protein